MEWHGKRPRKWHEIVTRFQFPQVAIQRHGGWSSFLAPCGVPSTMLTVGSGARASDVDGKIIVIIPTATIHRIRSPLRSATVGNVNPPTAIPDTRADIPTISPDPRTVHPTSASASIPLVIAIKVTTATIE